VVGKTAAITKEYRRRFEHLREIGCICCLSYGLKNTWIQVHYIVEGNKRLGHAYTLPLCYWHHEGVPPEGLTRDAAESMVGPSLKSKKRFNEVFGGERELLEWVNKMIEVMEE